MLCLRDDNVCWFLIPSSRLFQILAADGMHDFDETFVRVNDLEKL